jgi:hypothetical protein
MTPNNTPNYTQFVDTQNHAHLHPLSKSFSHKSINREILSELAESKIITPEKVLPVLVGLHLLDEYGALLPAMTSEIGLHIAIDVELACHPSAFNGKFPDRCSQSLAVPRDFTRKADIQ